MYNFEEKIKQYQMEDIHNEIMKLNCELTGVQHDLKNKAKDNAEFYFLCSKFVNIQNTIFKLKKELVKENDQDQEKKEDKE